MGYYNEVFDNNEQEAQEDFYNALNRQEKEAQEAQEAQEPILKHRYCKGLTIKKITPTAKGWKVEQTELYKSWSDKKLRKPKIKIAYYSDAEIKELFKDNEY